MDEWHHHNHTHYIEYGVEHRQFERVVVRRNAEFRTNNIHHRNELTDKCDRNQASDYVKYKMRTRQAFALYVGTHRTDYRGNGSAQIRTDS